MAPKTKSKAARPESLDLQKYQLDIKKTLAERLERQKKEQELGFLQNSNDSILLALPSFSDSMMDCSQDTTPLSDSKQSLHRIVSLNIFSESRTFQLFDEADVKFSWLNPYTALEDINLENPSMLILSEFKFLDLQKPSTKSAELVSRYLLFLLSVTRNKDVLSACTKILQERISSSLLPYSISVSDFVAVLVNYGASFETIWPSQTYNLTLSHPFNVKLPVLTERSTPEKLPIHNFTNLLNLFLLNLNTSPKFSIQEKIGMFNLFLNLSMDKTIIRNRFLLELVKSIITRLLESFTSEEWSMHDSTLVEELVICAFHHCPKLDTVGLVQRVSCLRGTSSRIIQTQQACAFFVAQECLGFQEITVCGTISVDDVLEVLGKVEKFPTDYEVAYCLVKAISFCIDLTHPSSEKEKILELARILNDWRHSIRDVSVDCDTNRLAVKDLITELTYQWKDPFPINNVV